MQTTLFWYSKSATSSEKKFKSETGFGISDQNLTTFKGFDHFGKFWGTQNRVFWHFWVPKNYTSGAQTQNLKPVFEISYQK